MELRRRGDPRLVFLVLSLVLAAIYIIVGLQPAEAANYEISAQLSIPAIGLDSDVTELARDGQKLNTPDTIVGAYTRAENKTLLIGHATTVFENLSAVKLGAEVEYNGKNYHVVARELVPKAQINMNKILAGAEKDTLVIMTCAGELYSDGDASHRFMITAVSE